MHIKKIIFNYEDYPTPEYYPFNINLFKNTTNIEFSTPVTFFIGENGSGKSTLLKAICKKCNIYIWEETERTRYKFNPYEEELYKYIDVQWVNEPVPGSFFDSRIFHDFSRFLDEWARATPAILEYFGGNSLITQSHGESLISFFSSVYKIKGLHFFDEPETALSPKSQLQLIDLLMKILKTGHSQFIIATHSPILLALPSAIIYSFDETTIKVVDYEDTEYYMIYKDFLNNRQKYLK